MESGHISVLFKTISFTLLSEVKMILLLLLLMSTAAVADGVEVIDYLGRDVQDVFSNSTTQRGKETYSSSNN
jgi:DNA-binding ferritin-like protein (Dps family)